MHVNKNILIIALIGAAVSCTSSTKREPVDKDAVSYAKNDLTKIKWIEGKWRGMAGNEPFYEIYQFTNDSTLMITGYEWDGKDSSKTSVDFLQWKQAAYYLGKDQNYKVTDITDAAIKMIPVKAANDILWRKETDSGWTAILKGKTSTLTYQMRSFDPFKK